jgi:hypothetical protein
MPPNYNTQGKKLYFSLPAKYILVALAHSTTSGKHVGSIHNCVTDIFVMWFSTSILFPLGNESISRITHIESV